MLWSPFYTGVYVYPKHIEWRMPSTCKTWPCLKLFWVNTVLDVKLQISVNIFVAVKGHFVMPSFIPVENWLLLMEVHYRNESWRLEEVFLRKCIFS